MNQETAPTQHEMMLDAPGVSEARCALAGLDLFSGLGGLAQGFKEAGFSMAGTDIEPVSEAVFTCTGGGEFVLADLATTMVVRNVDVLTGGPPCRPWSAVNQKRRLAQHDDHQLLAKFFEHVQEIRPAAFLMENVPPVGTDPSFLHWLDLLRAHGYRSESKLVRYSDFGGASARIRRFTVGLRNSFHGAKEFFARLKACRTSARTVRDAVFWARDLPWGAAPDHDWSQLRTIDKYRERYETGKFGWKRLNYDLPAPSFGSVAKTYILHPEAGIGNYPLRVLSVREALAIMDFGLEVRFPDGTPRAKRYQMTANAVSPRVARLCASVLRGLLAGELEPFHAR